MLFLIRQNNHDTQLRNSRFRRINLKNRTSRFGGICSDGQLSNGDLISRVQFTACARFDASNATLATRHLHHSRLAGGTRQPQ
jgi:hypothetical protein